MAEGTADGLGSKTLTINSGTIGANVTNITLDNLLTIGGSFNMGGVASTVV